MPAGKLLYFHGGNGIKFGMSLGTNHTWSPGICPQLCTFPGMNVGMNILYSYVILVKNACTLKKQELVLFFGSFQQQKIMFSSSSHLLLICFYLPSSILRLSLFQAAFVLNMQ